MGGAWLTCGKVHGIEVHADQGGLTHWSTKQSRMTCAQHFVLPAGYLGSALWGGVILVCCAQPQATRAAAFIIIVALFIALCYSLCGKTEDGRDWVLPTLCVVMMALLAGLLYLCYFT